MNFIITMKAVTAYALFVMLAIQNIGAKLSVQGQYLVIEGIEGKPDPSSTCLIKYIVFLKSAFYDTDREFIITWEPEIIKPIQQLQEQIEQTKGTGPTEDTPDLITVLKFDKFHGITINENSSEEPANTEKYYLGSIEEPSSSKHDYSIECKRSGRRLRSIL